MKEMKVKTTYEVQQYDVTEEDAKEWGIPLGMPSATFLVFQVVSESHIILQRKRVAVFKNVTDALTFDKWLKDEL